MFGFFRRRRRRRLRATPLPASAWSIIDRNVPQVRRMSERDRAELGGIVQVLVAEKRFLGRGGLEMTDEIRFTIAAQAAMLLMHRETGYYPTLTSILVYPSAYVVPTQQRLAGGVIVEGPQVRLGESWLRGSLVLAWDAVLAGARRPDDGRNVVLHEFAHQLDGESGFMEGAPGFERGSSCVRDWARVLGAEYDALVRQVNAGHRDLIDAYGATNPAEFFAVVTETFFERPVAMRARHPALYEELACFYRQDPAANGADDENAAGNDVKNGVRADGKRDA